MTKLKEINEKLDEIHRRLAELESGLVLQTHGDLDIIRTNIRELERQRTVYEALRDELKNSP